MIIIFPSMPVSVTDINEFLRLAEVAKECRVKRLNNEVKLKLRFKRRLYILKLPKEKANEVLKSIKCKVVEV